MAERVSKPGRIGRLCPTGKVSYWSRRKAKARLKRMPDRHAISVYACDEGDLPRHFHLGNKPADAARVGREALRERRAAAVEHERRRGR